jgi:hypothetical protein
MAGDQDMEDSEKPPCRSSFRPFIVERAPGVELVGRGRVGAYAQRCSKAPLTGTQSQ